MPTWLLFVIMSLAVYRLTRLVVKDTFPPILWLRDRLVGGWRPVTVGERRAVSVQNEGGDPAPFYVRDVDHGNGKEMSRWVDHWTWVPDWLAELLSCPWCASGWVSLAVVVTVCVMVGVALPLLVWLAVWAAGALIAAQRWA